MLVQPLVVVDQIMVVDPMLIQQALVESIMYGQFEFDPYETKVEVGPQFV